VYAQVANSRWGAPPAAVPPAPAAPPAFSAPGQAGPPPYAAPAYTSQVWNCALPGYACFSEARVRAIYCCAFVTHLTPDTRDEGRDWRPSAGKLHAKENGLSLWVLICVGVCSASYRGIGTLDHRRRSNSSRSCRGSLRSLLPGQGTRHPPLGRRPPVSKTSNHS
jgi:hypothetical protein